MNSIPKTSDYRYQGVGYSKIDKWLTIFGESDFDILFITDLNFTEEQFRTLGTYKSESNKIVYIDHHTYLYDIESLGKELNISVLWDKRFSGCLNTFQFLNGHIKNPHLIELNNLANIYDLWKIEDEYFSTKSFPLNDLFWKYSMNGFVNKFKDGYVLQYEDLYVIDQKKKDRDIYLKDSIQNHSIINKEDNILMILNPIGEYINDFLLFYSGYNAYLMLRTQKEGNMEFSVRLKEGMLTIDRLYSIIQELMNKKIQCGGHTIAGGLTILEEDFSLFMSSFNEAVRRLINVR